MIPDINHANNHSDDPRSPFERPNRANKLVIAIDRESLPNSDALENLLGFGRHEPIHMMSTRDEGVEHIIFGEESNDVLQYRIVPMEGDIDLGNGFRNGLRSAVPSMTQWRQFADEGEKKGYGKANDILNALTLAQLCVDRGVHILVTARNYLLTQAPRNIVKFSNPGTVQEALALVGLYLRTQNDFTYYRRPHPTNRNAGGLTMRLDRSQYFWELTRQLLDGSWRWFSACNASSAESKDERLGYLGRTLFTRFDRALRTRDKLQEQLRLVPTHNTAVEAMYYLDVIMLLISGCFDVLAQVATTAYGIELNDNKISWRRDEWRRALKQKDPTLFEATEKGKPSRDALELVSIFRNSIHGEALPGALVRDGFRISGLQMVLRKGDVSKVVELANEYGGIELWGIEKAKDDSLYAVNLNVFIEKLLPFVVAALNSIMELTQVDKLPGVKPEELMSKPTQTKSLYEQVPGMVRLLSGL
jgi:hypothetical protein